MGESEEVAFEKLLKEMFLDANEKGGEKSGKRLPCKSTEICLGVGDTLTAEV